MAMDAEANGRFHDLAARRRNKRDDGSYRLENIFRFEGRTSSVSAVVLK
jgi:hypothetical protein